jgi:PPOX class probable F420-dependent enzyme
MDQDRAALAAARTDRMLRSEPVVWLSSVCADGTPHLVPIWFSWDGDTVLIASKPHAKKVANLRANPHVMLALGEPDDDFDVGLLAGVAELLAEPAAAVLPPGHLAKYRTQMAAIGLTADEFLATYSQVIRIRPTRFLPWHGRTTRAGVIGVTGVTGATGGRDGLPSDRRIAAAIRRVSGRVAPTPASGSPRSGPLLPAWA